MLLARLHAKFQNVTAVGIPVELEGSSEVHYVYRGRRGPNKVVN